MPLEYKTTELLFRDDLTCLNNWHHEGIGELQPLPGGGMRLHCLDSKQGGRGCMAFFRPTLPDQIRVEYDIIVHSHGGLVINYLAIRGLGGEDMIADAAKLEPRPGEMKNYFALKWGLQSYHLSFSRFNDAGEHTNTSNWRRNPGALLAGHGNDPVKEIGRRYHVMLTKDEGALQFYADGVFAHGLIDRDRGRYPIPDYGKFGFRLIGSDVKVDVFNFAVHRVEPHPACRSNGEMHT